MSDKEIPIKLGNLIKELEKMGNDHPVKFDNDRLPTKLESWRGVYAELTLDSTSPTDKPITVGELLIQCRKAIGKTFTGYKGGDFKMSEDSLVYADEYGDSTGRAIHGITGGCGTYDSFVILETMIVNHW